MGTLLDTRYCFACGSTASCPSAFELICPLSYY
jgi:hypothetical protein